jgi:predicted aspartyl protease
VIQGTVTPDGVPMVSLVVAGQTWPATVDTGFNGDLELPEALRPYLNARFLAATEWLLAGGQRSVEDTYEVDFPFDGAVLVVEATFVADDSILIGTGLMAGYRLTVDFVAAAVLLERLASPPAA